MRRKEEEQRILVVIDDDDAATIRWHDGRGGNADVVVWWLLEVMEWRINKKKRWFRWCN